MDIARDKVICAGSSVQTSSKNRAASSLESAPRPRLGSVPQEQESNFFFDAVDVIPSPKQVYAVILSHNNCFGCDLHPQPLAPVFSASNVDPAYLSAAS